MSELGAPALPDPRPHDERIMAFSLSAYPTLEHRAAMRGALGDAAGLCDALARDIAAENSSRGRVTKRGQQLEAIAKRCGDAIWAMREKVHVPRG